MKKNNEYLYYTQKFLDLVENVTDEELKMQIKHAFFLSNKAITEDTNINVNNDNDTEKIKI